MCAGISNIFSTTKISVLIKLNLQQFTCSNLDNDILVRLM